MRAGRRAVPTTDTLRAVGGAGYVHIHFTYPAARTAGRTLLSIYLDAVNRYPVENAIERPERAEPFAEGAVKEYGEHNNSQQNAALPGEQPAQAGPDSGVGSGQRNTSFQDTSGTDVLAKEGIAQLRIHPYQVVIPAALICTTMLALNLLGDGLRDAFDPKLRGTE